MNDDLTQLTNLCIIHINYPTTHGKNKEIDSMYKQIEDLVNLTEDYFNLLTMENFNMCEISTHNIPIKESLNFGKWMQVEKMWFNSGRNMNWSSSI